MSKRASANESTCCEGDAKRGGGGGEVEVERAAVLFVADADTDDADGGEGIDGMPRIRRLFVSKHPFGAQGIERKAQHLVERGDSGGAVVDMGGNDIVAQLARDKIKRKASKKNRVSGSFRLPHEESAHKLFSSFSLFSFFFLHSLFLVKASRQK